MSRRCARRGARTLSTTSPQRILRLAPTMFLDADHYTTSGGNVVGYVDQARADTFASAGAAQAVPVADATLNGAKSATFSGNWFVSSLAASSWQFTNNGAGHEVFHVYVPTTVGAGARYQLCTRSGGTTGFACFESSAVTYHEVFSTVVTLVDAFVTGGSANVAYVKNSYYQEGRAGNEWSITRNATTSTGDSTAPPLDVPPAHTMVLGAFNDGGTNPTSERWACSILFARVLTAAERAVVRAWFAAKYGIAA